jgi:hypothetical protein
MSQGRPKPEECRGKTFCCKITCEELTHLEVMDEGRFQVIPRFVEESKV